MPNPQEDLELDSIQRCPHDAENPYAQILNEILRHQTLSIDAIWMLSYLLSNDRKWRIIIPQIINHVKGRMGKNRVYDVVNELIEFGYMQRIELKNGNLKAGFKYFISEKPKFKKCFRHPENRDTEVRDTENRDYKNTKVKEYQEKEENLSFHKSSSDQLLLPDPLGSEETPTAVVVDLFDDLKIRDTLRKKIQREYKSEEIKIGVQRCKEWVGRSNDEVGILTALKSPNDWNDVTKNNDKDKNKEKAIEILKKYEVNNKCLTINILNEIIEFLDGSMRPICLWIADYGFIEQLENTIEKMIFKNLMRKA